MWILSDTGLLPFKIEVQGSLLVLYQFTDLTEPQPDAYKYVPLFLLLRRCQLGREAGLFWEFSVFFSQGMLSRF